MRIDFTKALLAATAVTCLAVTAARAQRDPNDVPHDPHPMESRTDVGGTMLVHGDQIYIQKGGRLYRVPTTDFRNEKVSWVDLP